jgi:hypothetical protein
MLPTELNILLSPLRELSQATQKNQTVSVQPGLDGSNDFHVGQNGDISTVF